MGAWHRPCALRKGVPGSPSIAYPERAVLPMCKCINLERLQLSMKGIYRDARNDFGVVTRPAVSADRNPRVARLASAEL